jgi:hypothetical protein
VVAALRTSRALTDLQCNPDTDDATILNAEAVPMLQLNRLRLVTADAKRSLASSLGSTLVRRHPMITYYLSRINVDTLVFRLLKSTSSEQIWDGRLASAIVRLLDRSSRLVKLAHGRGPQPPTYAKTPLSALSYLMHSTDRTLSGCCIDVFLGQRGTCLSS